jgi:serine protease inhibitor
LQVNEKGTEAAAATAVVMSPRGRPMVTAAPPKIFNADHSYLLTILERKHNAILFAGRVVDHH